MASIRNFTMSFGFGRASRLTWLVSFAGERKLACAEVLRFIAHSPMNFGFGRTACLTCAVFFIRQCKLACAEIHRFIAHTPRLRHG
jgi:hypothetical protein